MQIRDLADRSTCAIKDSTQTGVGNLWPGRASHAREEVVELCSAEGGVGQQPLPNPGFLAVESGTEIGEAQD